MSINIKINNEENTIEINKLESDQDLQEKYNKMVEKNPLKLRDVPDRFKSYRMCLNAYIKDKQTYNDLSLLFRELLNNILYASYNFPKFELNNIDSYILKNELTNQMNNIYAKKISQSFSNHFNEILDSKNFLELMVTSGAVITGSFVLQSIYGESYENSDVDIFVNSKKGIDLCLYMRELIIKTTSSESRILPKEKNADYAKYVKSSEKGKNADYKKYMKSNKKENNIRYVETYLLCGKKIQIIGITDDINVIEYIRGDFDLDICKNILGYKKNQKKYKPYLLIYDLHSIVNKKTRQTHKKIRDERRIKYESRGFIIDKIYYSA